ncbi:branched-chain amino acid ABC transporter permease [Haloarchaeobius sp. HRN-SO-5]|uniref:branched-chain amino acid ABC transporter permease n=1 Tax=Haloarchaeobius sp. HRN-SO-5 TaxID=3446118 RepID=UPI003EB9BD38
MSGEDVTANRSGSFVDDVRDWYFESDVRMVLVTLLVMYVGFFVIGALLGTPFSGQIAALQQLTLLMAVYAMLSLALNIHWGYTGLFNIGITGFMAVGAYTFAIATASPDPTSAAGTPGLGLPFVVGLLLALLASGFVGFLAALPTLRLRADYLAIVTIALSEIIRFAFKSRSLQRFTVGPYELFGVQLMGPVEMGTGGASGITVDKPPQDLLLTFLSETPGFSIGYDLFVGFGEAIGVATPAMRSWIYTIFLIFLTLAFYVLVWRIGFSPFGRVLKAIREDEDVANALGKNTRSFKMQSFVVGCMLMGLVGVFWWASAGFINTQPFKPQTTFFVWIALIIGGAGSTTGSLMGGILFIGLLFQGPIRIVGLVRQTLDIGSGAAPATIVDGAAALLSLDPMPLFAYFLANIQSLRLVLMGAVLVWLMQNRPEGLLGHRKELATSLDRDRVDRQTSAAAATDGGEDG